MVQHGLHTFRSFRPKIRYSCCSICPSGMQVRNPSRLPKQEQKMLGQGFLGTWREPMMITDAFLPLFVSISQGGIQWPRPYRHWWLWLDQPPEHKHPPGRWSKPSPRAQWLEPRWSGQQTCHRCWWRRGGKIWRPSLRPVQESTVPTAPHRVPKLSLSWSLFGSLVVRLAGPLTLSELGGKQTETASQGRAKQNRPKELTWSGSPSSLQEPGAFEDIRGLVLVGDVLVGFSYLGDPNTQANTQASLHAMFAMFCSSKTILLLSSFLICLICFGLKGEQSQGIGGRARSRPQVLKTWTLAKAAVRWSRLRDARLSVKIAMARQLANSAKITNATWPKIHKIHQNLNQNAKYVESTAVFVLQSWNWDVHLKLSKLKSGALEAPSEDGTWGTVC